MTFEFATAARILFGAGRRKELFPIAAGYGRRALVVTGANPRRAGWLGDGLTNAGVNFESFFFDSEPTVARVEEGRRLARVANCEFVVGVGGGSVIDGAKAIAALATNGQKILDYLEVIGEGKALENPPLPFIAIPTTAGTGTEVTRNSVLLSPEHQVKVSLRSAKMLPTLAVVDPELTYDLPPNLTASTGMDALTQLIEPFLCARANPMVDAICREGIPRVARALPIVFHDGHAKEARCDMALGSLFGGLALANSGLGAVHGFAGPIGGMFPAPHGAVCAALLGPALAVNRRALQERAGGSEPLRRFSELAELLGGDAIDFVQRLAIELKIPSLRRYGLTETHIPLLCSRAAQASSMKANPIGLTSKELAEILIGAI